MPQSLTSTFDLASTHAPIQPGSKRLSIADVVRVARYQQSVLEPDTGSLEKILDSLAWVEDTVRQISGTQESNQKPVAYYGINTGFGALAGRSALDSTYLTKVLGHNLISSHSVGVGTYFTEDIVRGTLLIRAQSLAQGYSGVRPLVISKLLAMLNERVYPAVPEQGSLGASGDLAPLAHLLLTLCSVPTPDTPDQDLALDNTDGEAFIPVDPTAGIDPSVHLHLTDSPLSDEQQLWQRVSGAEAMQRAGGKIELQTKEALALCNGATVSAAIAALVVQDAQNLLENAELVVAMTLEGMRGFRDPFYPHVHEARGHVGAMDTAAKVLSYVEDSEILDPGNLSTRPQRVPPQDPYSVRCAPQVMGSIRDTLDMAQRWIEMEINAATDNPLIFTEMERDYKTISGGNFHGEPIAMAMDYLSIALTELASISDRRMFNLIDYNTHKVYADTEQQQPLHGLPGFLIDEPAESEGLNAGLMMLQATAASLVSDCKVLSHPDTVDSIPSSASQEDHVSMSLNAARHARDIVKNVENVLALEFLCANQAIALQRAKHGNEHLRQATGTQAASSCMREAGITMLTQDRVLYPDIRKALRLVKNGELVKAAQSAAANTRVEPC